MNEITNSDSIDFVQYLKGLAILGVIMIHVTAGFTNINSFNSTSFVLIFLNQVSRFAVPLFVIISGLVLSRKYFYNFNIKYFYYKRLKKIIPLYLLFSIIYLLFKVLYGLDFTVTDIIIRLLTGEAEYHLWFIPLIIQLYLLYPILIHIYQKFDEILIVNTLLFLSLLMQCGYQFIVSDLDLPSIFKSGFFLSYLFYFYIGIHIGRNYEKLSDFSRKANTTSLFLLVIIVVMLNTFRIGDIYYGIYNYNLLLKSHYITIPILSITVLLLSVKTNLNIQKYKFYKHVVLLGNVSFEIYLVHALVLRFITYTSEYFTIYYYTIPHYYILSFIITIFLSYIVALLMVKYLSFNKKSRDF